MQRFVVAHITVEVCKRIPHKIKKMNFFSLYYLNLKNLAAKLPTSLLANFLLSAFILGFRVDLHTVQLSSISRRLNITSLKLHEVTTKQLYKHTKLLLGNLHYESILLFPIVELFPLRIKPECYHVGAPSDSTKDKYKT